MSWKWYWSLTSPLILINPFSCSADPFWISRKGAFVCKMLLSVKRNLFCHLFPFFLYNLCKSENSRKRMSIFVAPCLCAAFKALAEIMYCYSSYKACLHASPQQRKVKALSLFVFHLHTQYATWTHFSWQNAYKGWVMRGSLGRHRLRCMAKNRSRDSLVGECERSRRVLISFHYCSVLLLHVVVAGAWVQLQGN